MNPKYENNPGYRALRKYVIHDPDFDTRSSQMPSDRDMMHRAAMEVYADRQVADDYDPLFDGGE